MRQIGAKAIAEKEKPRWWFVLSLQIRISRETQTHHSFRNKRPQVKEIAANLTKSLLARIDFNHYAHMGSSSKSSDKIYAWLFDLSQSEILMIKSWALVMLI